MVREDELRILLYQVGSVFVAWLFLCGLYWNNDGLWFQGDAPRHALNGLFWKDFLLSGSFAPKEFALRYYARYPAISPTAYPPAFYLLEAVSFGIIGESPYVAKGLVLLFALMASFYNLIWLRRWLGEPAGWAGMLFPLLPGMVRWSHAILLNVPAFAIGLAALFHSKCWIDAKRRHRSSSHIYPAIFFSIGAVLTYYPAAIMLLVIPCWLLWEQPWKEIDNAKIWAILGGGVLFLFPIILIVFHWAPTYMSWIVPHPSKLLTLENWIYYPRSISLVFPLHLIALAIIGIFLGLRTSSWRQETKLLLIWTVVTLTILLAIQAKSPRYILPLSTPFICFAIMSIWTLISEVKNLLHKFPKATSAIAPSVLGLLIGIQVFLAWNDNLPQMRHFQKLVSFLENNTTEDAYFYDGHHSGVFTFYVRIGDPEYRHWVVKGSKLLYAGAIEDSWRTKQFVFSPKEVVERLRQQGGCRWLIIENGKKSADVPAAQHLREAVQGPEFQRVKSFTIPDYQIERIDVYRFLAPIEPVKEVVLPFPVLGRDVKYRVRPISKSEG